MGSSINELTVMMAATGGTLGGAGLIWLVAGLLVRRRKTERGAPIWLVGAGGLLGVGILLLAASPVAPRILGNFMVQPSGGQALTASSDSYRDAFTESERTTAPAKASQQTAGGPAAPAPAQQTRPDTESPRKLPGESTSRFRHYGVNPFVLSREDHLSTFALDGDTASFDLLVNSMEAGRTWMPPAESVRVEDFVNAMEQGYRERAGPDAEPGLHLMLDAGPSHHGPPDTTDRLLRVGVHNIGDQGPREPVSLILVIDTSGSMDGHPMRQASRFAGQLEEYVRPDDRVALITYGGDQATVGLEPGPAAEANLPRLINGLEARGSTPLADAVREAYRLARDELDSQERPVRIVMIADGYGNVGPSDPELLDDIERRTAQDITLSTVGVGGYHYDDIMMEALANRGNGTYRYAKDNDELSPEVAAMLLRGGPRDTRIQVRFEPDAVRAYRLIGYENRDVEDEAFYDDALDFGEPGFGRDVTALYEVRMEPGVKPSAEAVRVTLRWRPARGEFRDTVAALTAGELAQGPGSEHLRRSAAMAELAEIMRGSPHGECEDPDAVRQAVESADLRDDSQELASRLMRNLPEGWASLCGQYRYAG